MRKILVSGCLMGLSCRYDGCSKPCQKVLDLPKDGETVLIPVCPEQLGGLPTPRLPSERQGDDGTVTMKDGTDVSAQYRRGAELALQVARINGVTEAILKSGSPSCGKGLIYDGTFSGQKREGNGVTVELFEKNGITVRSENDL